MRLNKKDSHKIIPTMKSIKTTDMWVSNRTRRKFCYGNRFSCVKPTTALTVLQMNTQVSKFFGC